ncbi:MAG: hypothetical protein KJ749_00560 [Planctomycetes bacterium]|nr:hypothetical protein [Planctomycetota bacterium]
MMSSAEPPEIFERARPPGFVQPDHERAIRALRALAEERLNDAASNIEAIPESLPILQTWKQLLGGMLAIARGELSRARDLLSEAAGLPADETPTAGEPGRFPQPNAEPRALTRADFSIFEPRASARADSPCQKPRTLDDARDTMAESAPDLFRKPCSGTPPTSPLAKGGFRGVARCTEGEKSPTDSYLARLTSRALDQLGLVYRRWDQPEDAYRWHLQAFLLRSEHGSHEEMWESAMSLGTDADISGWHDNALAWHRRAINAATMASEESESKQATAWTNLATSLSRISRHDEAVEAARTARNCWHRHDLGAVTAAKADARLGSVLLKQAEALHETAPNRARAALEEAAGLLNYTADALEAFGPQNTPDIRWCREQIDFAERLGRSIPE